MHIYIVPRTAGDFPLALDEGLRTPDALEESPYPLSTASSDYDDLLEMLDREIDFYNGPSGAEADVRYFDVDDLYLGWQHEEAYDYPRGIDDDEDLYVRDTERISVEHGALSGKHPPQWDQFDFGALEEEITNAQYFDLLELRSTPLPLPDVPVPSDGEDETDSDFEIDDSLGPHLTVSDGVTPVLAKARRRQLGRGDGVNLYGDALVFRRLDYSGLDGLEERTSDVVLSSDDDVWMDGQLC